VVKQEAKKKTLSTKENGEARRPAKIQESRRCYGNGDSGRKVTVMGGRWVSSSW